MLSVTLRQLEYAVAVAEHGGVSAAAAAINVSQPALSVAVARLEEQLGKSLFIRRKGGPSLPTSFGREFIEEARRLLTAVERLVDPDAMHSHQRRPIVIGCFEDLAPLVLAPILIELRKTRPNTPISTRIGGFERLSEDLRTGQLDFAVTYDLGLDETIQRRQIAKLSPHAVVAKMHPFANLSDVSLAMLENEPLILADQGHSIRHMIDLFQQRGLMPRIAHRAASLETMRSLAGNGLGVGLSYTMPATRRSYDGKPLVSLKITDEKTAEPVVIATSSLNEPTQFADELIDDIVKMSVLTRSAV